ncbi:hypothetical protein TNCV_2759831 [Trichonephila clavipes]|nr:hypothetical protein TNCV_2759831 [Trichonephila clavipes]
MTGEIPGSKANLRSVGHYFEARKHITRRKQRLTLHEEWEAMSLQFSDNLVLSIERPYENPSGFYPGHQD